MSSTKARKDSASNNVRLNLAGNPAIVYETVRSDPHLKAISEGRSINLAPKHIVFPLHLNEHIDCTLATFGVVDDSKTKMELVTSTGDIVVLRFPRASEQLWRDRKWVRYLNNWRGMNIKRRLSPNGEKVMDYGRPRWSVTEFNSFKKLVLDKVASSGRDLDTKDFDNFRIQHNKRWE
ncbi:hypothetical protein M7I_6452 [Glarea lozoyensis 74030]|uniref:Uncharacterized protein n=1 Tax=Glarea lozoyensis (strain ATCC 74030 / MF5533) TaxID=1104152 RepID=H0EUL5_GLAL7|nr:hypothetical protein M7I_6452 [Glarea lozoyensis 74030]